MTKEERAIDVINHECYRANLLDLDETIRINNALDVAVEALKFKKSIDEETRKKFVKFVLCGVPAAELNGEFLEVCRKIAGVFSRYGRGET